MVQYIRLALAATLVISCSKISPKGDITIQQMPVSDFSQIEGHGKFRVFLVKSNENKIEAETYPNIFKNLEVKQKNGQLVISENRPTQGVDFYNLTIYTKQYPTKISLADSIDFNVSGDIKAQNLQIQLRDNAKFIGAIRTDKTELDMQNSSLANIKGFTKEASLKLKDTAGMISPYWLVDQMNINAQNHIYAEVNAKNLLSGNLTDTSKMLFYNNPVQKFKHSPKTTIENKKLD